MPIPPKKLKSFKAQQKQQNFRKQPEKDDDQKGDEAPEEKKPEKKQEPEEKKGGNPASEKKARKLAAFAKRANGKQDEPEEEEAEEGGEQHDEPEENGERHMNEDEAKDAFLKATNEVENGPDSDIVAAMGGYDGNGQAPEGFDPGLWEAAQEIAGVDDGADAPDAWLLVAHVYKHLGGEVPGKPKDGAMPNEAEQDDEPYENEE